MRTLATEVFQEGWFVLFIGGSRGVGVGGFELCVAGLAIVDVAEEIEVMVQEVCRALSQSIRLRLLGWAATYRVGSH